MVRINHSFLNGLWGFALATALLLHYNALRATTNYDKNILAASSLQNDHRFSSSIQTGDSSSNTTSAVSDWPGQPRADLSNPKRSPLIRIEHPGVDNPVLNARDYLLQHLTEFLEIYGNRPDKNNLCGIRINHALMIWMVAKRLQPTTIIESGINAGQSTYFFRRACPKAHIISMDPSTTPICGQSKRWMDTTNKNEYLVGDTFVDFDDVDWGKRIQQGDLDPSNTLVFIDDHVGFFKRFPTIARYGFKHVINEDNYKPGEGATTADKNYMTPKQMFRARAKTADSVWLFHNLEVYAEFPPLLPPILSQNTTHVKKKEGGILHHSDDLRFMEEPLLRPDVDQDDHRVFERIAKELHMNTNMEDDESFMEWMSYNYIAYMRVVPLAPRLAKAWNLT